MTGTVFRRADDLPSGPFPLARATAGRRRFGLALPAPPPSWRLPGGWVPWAVAAVTLAGAFLRFYRLTYPALWNDETLVYWRACGTYGQMLVPLHLDGFPPLHYSLYWWLGHPVPVGADATRPVIGTLVAVGLVALSAAVAAAGVRREPLAWVRWGVTAGVAAAVAVALAVVAVLAGPGWMVPWAWVPGPHTLKLTPWVMRSVPAISGTLMVPAMYFLARQLLPAGTAVVAAVVTACSAFMLFYSRDAKMYPDAWLFIALNVGCLLWWFRTGRSTAFLCWVAAGCAAVGLHPSSLTIPGLTTVFLLTQRHLHWRRAVLFLAGLGLIYTGPAGYYAKFNVWIDRVEAVGWSASGIGWAGSWFNGDRTGPEYVGYTSSAFLAGYEWPRDDYQDLIEPSLAEVPQTAFLVLAGVLVVAALPWPLVRTALFPGRQAAREAAGPEPAWRVWLWLATWIAVPAYGFYCHSVDGFVSPRGWIWNLAGDVPAAEWALVAVGLAGVVVAAGLLGFRPLPAVVGRTAAFWAATAAVFGLCYVVFVVCFGLAMKDWMIGRPWGQAQGVWLPRYLGFLWPAVGVGTAALLMRLPTRAVRGAAIGFFCLVNLGMASMRMVLCTEPPIDRLAADEWAAQGRGATTHTYYNMTAEGIEVAGTSLGINNYKIAGGRYYLEMLSDRPMSPSLFERSLDEYGPGGYQLRAGFSEGLVRHDLRTSPGVRRAVFWSQMFANEQLGWDPFKDAVPPGWRLVSEDVYPVRVVWDWREKWRWVRREYVRPDPGQDAPARAVPNRTAPNRTGPARPGSVTYPVSLSPRPR